MPSPAPASRVLAPAVPELESLPGRVLRLTVAGGLAVILLAEAVALVAAVLLLSSREPEIRA